MTKTDQKSNSKPWCLILGASSGLGLATAKKMGAEGYNLILIHRDRKNELPRIQDEFKELESHGVRLICYNQDAIQEANRNDLINKLEQDLREEDKIQILVHSIAKGNLKDMGIGNSSLGLADLQLTLNAMALSLYDWVRDLIQANLLDKDTRVIAYTSEGNNQVWPGYGAVSAAKATLESLVRQMAVEFAPLGIKANCVQAGVTDTPSLRMIPQSERLLEKALKRNPNNRTTRPEDVANVAFLLTTTEALWITGTVIKADGGESLR